MIAEGQIVYFRPFYFNNGNPSKNKYFITLKCTDAITILACLPTSVNKAPSFITVPHGCINHDDRCFNCYLFQPKRIITTNGFSFPLNTFVYGNEVESYSITTLESNYKIEGVDYEIVGTLVNTEFEALKECLRNSSSVKRGVKRHL